MHRNTVVIRPKRAILSEILNHPINGINNMKKTALSLLLLSSSILYGKGGTPSKNYFTCRTGLLIIKNDCDPLLTIHKNMETEHPSTIMLKANESAQFKTDKDNEKIILEIIQYDQKRRVTVEGQALAGDLIMTLPISALYEENE